MTAKVVQFAQIGTVTFRKNRRSKNVKISVKPDKSVHVSFPFYVSTREVAAFVVKNEDWILSQQQKFEARKNVFDEGTTLKTKLYNIVFVRGEKDEAFRSNYNLTLKVKDFNSESSKRFIENTLLAIYRYEAKKLLPPRLKELAEQFHYKYNKVTIRNNKRNWGSCSSKNNISLNLQMMKLQDELIDYILIHELVHTEIKNHRPEFWERLNQLTNNNAKELAKKVSQYSTYTL